MHMLFLIICLLIIAALAILVYLVCKLCSGRKKNAKNEKHPLNPTNKAPENGKKNAKNENHPINPTNRAPENGISKKRSPINNDENPINGRIKNAKNEDHPLNPTNKAPENGSRKKYGEKEHQPLSFPNHKKKDATNLMDEAQINVSPISNNGHPAKKNLSKQQLIDNTDQHPPNENKQPNEINLSNQSQIHNAEERNTILNDEHPTEINLSNQPDIHNAEEHNTIINNEHPTEKKDEDICMICEYMKFTLFYELQCKHRICLWCVFGGFMKGPMIQCYKCRIEYCISNYTVNTYLPVYKLMRKIKIEDIFREDLQVPSAETKICVICKKNQNDMPRLKACEHSICRNCLVEHVKKNNENTEIPLCPVCSNELIVEKIKPRYEPFIIKFRLM